MANLLQEITRPDVHRGLEETVVNEEPYGIVTLDDFVVLLSGEFDSVADVIQAESPPY